MRSTVGDEQNVFELTRSLMLAAGILGALAYRTTSAAEDVSGLPLPAASGRTGPMLIEAPIGPSQSTSQQTPSGSTAPLPQASAAPEGQTIDLASALRLAGVQNLSLVIAQQRVEYAVALQQFAAAKILPSLNLGGSYDNHTGVLQQGPGNIITLNRGAMYVGAGANAVGAGAVQIPGLVYNLNLSEAIYGYLVTRQETRRATFDRAAVDNAVLRDVALAYTDLLHTAGLRSLAVLARNDTGEIARLTANYAKTGDGRQADADRAATEFARRDEELLEALAAEDQASHALCELLNLDQTLRLVPVQSQVVPQPTVPTQMPLSELLAVAALNRPELLARRAALRAAMLELDGARVLPFSPTVLMGFSGGAFGGGSDIAASQGLPRFGDISGRTDLDVALYWTLRNLGVGNKALIDAARARLRASEFQELDVLDSVRQEVVDSYVQALSWLAQVNWHVQAVRSGEQASKEDLIRVRGREARPIELLDSLRQVIEARRDYLNAIIGYNRAEVRLYVALGNAPVDMLARPVPAELLRPPDQTLDAGISNPAR
ncbi:MAG TPA: TolC family protein [Planctomycetaceae bacterium]|jgi:outer membrane protein TolC|nr:TolC family protein [Planctomycetaceae bacterium]